MPHDQDDTGRLDDTAGSNQAKKKERNCDIDREMSTWSEEGDYVADDRPP